MDQRTRTVKTLVCLFSAMSGTALLLGWMDPSPPLGIEPLTLEQLDRVAHSVVAGDFPIRADAWHEVEVRRGVCDPGDGVLLVARTEAADAHFVVDRFGRPCSTSRWRRQQPATDAPTTIRIEVAALAPDAVISAAQLDGVEALLIALNDEVVAGGETIPVTGLDSL